MRPFRMRRRGELTGSGSEVPYSGINRRCAPCSTRPCYERFPRIYRGCAADLGGQSVLSVTRLKRSPLYHTAFQNAMRFVRLYPRLHRPRCGFEDRHVSQGCTVPYGIVALL